jgi:hypothetical protein
MENTVERGGKNLQEYEVIFKTLLKQIGGTEIERDINIKVYVKDEGEVYDYIEAYKKTFGTEDEMIIGVSFKKVE